MSIINFLNELLIEIQQYLLLFYNVICPNLFLNKNFIRKRMLGNKNIKIIFFYIRVYKKKELINVIFTLVIIKFMFCSCSMPQKIISHEIWMFNLLSFMFKFTRLILLWKFLSFIIILIESDNNCLIKPRLTVAAPPNQPCLSWFIPWSILYRLNSY